MLIKFGLLLLLVGSGLVWSTEPPTDRPKQVLTFYYPWYGIPAGPGGKGRVVHWGIIDNRRRDISASLNYPALGAYDSYDPDVIDQHCRWAQEAGIDGFVVSWWGHDSYEDQAMPLLLDAGERHGLKLCVYYEKVPEPVTPNQAVNDIIRLAVKYGQHPAYLQADGKAVLFVYIRALNDLGLLGWHEVQTRLANYPLGVCLIGDQMGYAAATVFDGIHTYNTAGQLRDLDAAEVKDWAGQVYPNWVFNARQLNKISTLTLIPGYDDTKIREPGLAVDRRAGQLYGLQWETLLTTDPDWVLITSFNEWHEGSEIEPSLEHGRAYLDWTRDYADRFKNPRREPNAPPAGIVIDPNERDLLRARLEPLSIASLPDPQSTAFWWLLGEKPDLQVLSWEQIADGALLSRNIDLLLYCGGEHYRPTVHEDRDVDRAIQAYLDQGGSLAALPAYPMPFYYDETTGQAVRRYDDFGLTLRVAWEKPNEEGLQFVQPQSILTHTPTRFDFPTTGDQRWRPFYPTGVIHGYQPLLQLRDQSNRYHGDGLVLYRTPAGGKILYAWFGLLRDPRAPAMLFDSFNLLVP